MARTLEEILKIAHDRKDHQLQELTCRELQVLLFELNRTRYALKEAEAFIRFYMLVHDAIQDCRASDFSPFERPP
jgi:hypothetical protein